MFEKLIEKVFPSIGRDREKVIAETNQLKAYNKYMDSFIESIPAFARDLDEDSWGTTTIDDKNYYDQADIYDSIHSSRRMYYVEPMARCVIDTMVNYIVGKHAAIEPLDPDEKVKEYWDNWEKVNKFDKKMKEIVHRTLRDGEAFIRRFNPERGKQYRYIRFIDPLEIKNPQGSSYGNHSFGIETDPNDIEKPLYYYREYTVNNIQHWEKIPASEIIHIKINSDSDVKRGLSFLTGVSRYIHYYSRWLKDRINLNRMRTMFSLIIKPQAGTTAGIKSSFEDVAGKNQTGGTPKKKIPKPGSTLIAKGVDYEYLSLNIGANDTAEDGRAISLMVAIGTNIAEYIVRGDASNSNYSSTMVSESPFIKNIEYYQDLFEEPIKQLYEEEITWAVNKGYLPENTKKEKTITKPDYLDPETGQMIAGETRIRRETSPIDKNCNIKFSENIHRSLKDDTESITAHRASEWISDHTAAAFFGYDFDYEQEMLKREKREQQKQRQAFDLFGVDNRNQSQGDNEENEDNME